MSELIISVAHIHKNNIITRGTIKILSSELHKVVDSLKRIKFI